MPAKTSPRFADDIDDTPRAAVTELLREWLEPAELPSCEVSILAGGAVNQNFLIEYGGGRRAVLRLAPPPALADALGVEMRNSVRVATMVGEAGAGPRVIGSRPASGDTLIEFLDGMLDVSQIHQTDAIAAIGAALRTVHQLPTAGVRTKTAFEDIDEWLEGTREQGIYPADKVATISPRLTMLRAVFDEIEGLCVCHRDLNPQNCAWSEGKAHIIDWDFSGVDTPYLDLAMLTDYAEFSPAETALFARATLGEPTAIDMARIAVMRFVNSVREWAWTVNATARQKGRTKTIAEYLPGGGEGHADFYAGYAAVNWERVERILAEPAFEEACDLAGSDLPAPGHR